MEVSYSIAKAIFFAVEFLLLIMLIMDIRLSALRIKKMDNLLELISKGEVSYIRAVAEMIKLTAPEKELKKLEAKEQSPAPDSKQLVNWNEYKKATEKTQSH